MGVVVKAASKSSLNVAGEGFNLRGQPGLRLALCPQQLFTKHREPGALAFVPDDEGTP